MARKKTPQMTSLTDSMAPPSVELAGMTPAVRKPADATTISVTGKVDVHNIVDLSGSTMVLHDLVKEQIDRMIAAFLAEPELSRRVRVCLTLMSCKVVTSGYLALKDFQAPPIYPGGTSPLGLLTDTASDIDDADRAAGNLEETKLQVYWTDGIASDPEVFDKAIGRLRGQQEKYGTHVFVVQLGPTPSAATLRLSVHHEPVQLRNVADVPALEKIFAALQAAVRMTAKNPVALATVRSMTLEELEEAALAGS